MSPPLPSLTEVWHNHTYPEISSLRPDLSAAKKTVGSGIDRACALAYAQAGAEKIVLIGRTEEKLRETQQLLSLLAVGYQPEPSTTQEASIDDWLQSFETNVKGTMIPSKVFLPSAYPAHSSILAFTTAVVFPPTMLYLGAENPSTFAVALSPGMVDTAMLRKSGADPTTFLIDTASCRLHCMALKPRGVILEWPECLGELGRQRTLELKYKAEKIKSGLLLTSGVYGWPFNADS
ncbi:hypothetical protein N7488_000040 [Penicillium malachiteum]|nr:hypothetical protein N7488_000040 [Penicillium malachiteum]